MNGRHGTALSIVPMTGTVQRLRDVEVPEKYYSRLTTGIRVLDEIFGGPDMPGMVPGSSWIFTGMPGAGKSTMALQLAELLFSHSGRSVLYNVGEESKAMVRLAAGRLGLTGEFELSDFEEVGTLVEFCRSSGIEVLVQDSLQSLGCAGLEGPRRLKQVVKKLVHLANTEGITMFVIGHITKGGRFAGPQEIVHDVDAHAHLRLNKETGNRVFEILKNRHGPTHVPVEFMLSGHGLDFQQSFSPPTEEGARMTRAAARRDSVREMIKERLLSGEQVSGYHGEQWGLDCSGGFFRAMLRTACAELANEGHIIGEARVDGRLHSYIEV